jgi:hypothetical protein
MPPVMLGWIKKEIIHGGAGQGESVAFRRRRHRTGMAHNQHSVNREIDEEFHLSLFIASDIDTSNEITTIKGQRLESRL